MRFWFQAVFFAIVALVGLLLGQAIVIAFGVMGMLAAGVAWFWYRVSLEELVYERTLSSRRIFAGEELGMTVTLTNKKIVPLAWVRVEDEVPLELSMVEGDVEKRIRKGQILRMSTSIAWYERVRWNYRMQSNVRGVYRIGPAHIESGEPFGFLGQRSREVGQDSLIVYPRVLPLEDIGIPSGRPLGEVRGGIRIFQDPSRPSGLREYQRGDALNTVDWKATAKTQTLHVRTYEPSSSTSVILVVAVDTSSPYWASYAPTTVERIITVAASFASYAAGLEYSIGLFTNDLPIFSNRPMNVPPGRGPEQLSEILAALAVVRSLAMAPMSSQLAEFARRFPLGATLAVCTAFMPPEFALALSELKTRGFKVIVLYVGEEPCSDLSEGIQVYELYDYVVESEQERERVAG